MYKIFFIFLVPIFFLPKLMLGQYCIDAAGSTADYYDIKQIKIYENGNLIYTNTSGCGLTGNPWTSINGKYSDYTTQNIFLRRNKSFRLVVHTDKCITSGWAGAHNHLWFGIDYLKLDTLVLVHNPTFPNFYQGDSIVYNFSIPSITTTKNTRMRIRMDMNCMINHQCVGYQNGETEDYTVHFCEPLTYATESYNPRCYRDSTGYHRIYVTGGTAPIQYRWNNGSFQNNSINDKLKSGWNYFTIKDKDNCQYLDSFYLEDPE